jgi:hypothetical protein
MALTVESAISSFGAAATAKLSNVAVGGNPEDQIRAPFEQLLIDMALLASYTLLVELEPAQADLLKRICYGPLLSNDTLTAAGALIKPPKPEKLKKPKKKLPQLF